MDDIDSDVKRLLDRVAAPVDVEVQEDGYSVLWGPVFEPAVLDVHATGAAVLSDPGTSRDSVIPAEVLAEVVERHQLTADLRRQLEQARGIAVQLEQQLAELVALTKNLVVADDGQVWWVSPVTGDSVALGPGSLRLRLAQVVTKAAEVTSRG